MEAEGRGGGTDAEKAARTQRRGQAPATAGRPPGVSDDRCPAPSTKWRFKVPGGACARPPPPAPPVGPFETRRAGPAPPRRGRWPRGPAGGPWSLGPPQRRSRRARSARTPARRRAPRPPSPVGCPSWRPLPAGKGVTVPRGGVSSEPCAGVAPRFEGEDPHREVDEGGLVTEICLNTLEVTACSSNTDDTGFTGVVGRTILPLAQLNGLKAGACPSGKSLAEHVSKLHPL
ncbi:proline-rich proteoglycan 2-like [Manacus candei]|uniref:proline-rich proteoglycan 2-like n=1 Tax=Manacus candei TaxID=415023 RepID=UPI00222777F7|nr:proline-rich proteoglycan 2-like [Manacus candei]